MFSWCNKKFKLKSYLWWQLFEPGWLLSHDSFSLLAWMYLHMIFNQFLFVVFLLINLPYFLFLQLLAFAPTSTWSSSWAKTLSTCVSASILSTSSASTKCYRAPELIGSRPEWEELLVGFGVIQDSEMHLFSLLISHHWHALFFCEHDFLAEKTSMFFI